MLFSQVCSVSSSPPQVFRIWERCFQAKREAPGRVHGHGEEGRAERAPCCPLWACVSGGFSVALLERVPRGVDDCGGVTRNNKDLICKNAYYSYCKKSLDFRPRPVLGLLLTQLPASPWPHFPSWEKSRGRRGSAPSGSHSARSAWTLGGEAVRKTAEGKAAGIGNAQRGPRLSS